MKTDGTRMRKRLLALLALVVLSGCNSNPSNNPFPTNDPHSPITLTIKAEDGVLRSKPTIFVICEIKNVSDQPREIRWLSCHASVFDWFVDGRQIMPRDLPPKFMGRTLTLKPQEISRYKVAMDDGWGWFKITQNWLDWLTGTCGSQVSHTSVFQSNKEYRVRALLKSYSSLTGKPILSNEITVRIP